MVFTLFSCLFVVKISNKFFAFFYSMISLINSENLASNPPQEACSGFQVAAYDSKSCSESRLWFWKLFWKPAMTCTVHCRRSANDSKAKSEQKFWSLSEQSSELASVFKEAADTLLIFFSFTRQLETLKTICAYTESNWYKLQGLQKNIHLVTQSLSTSTLQYGISWYKMFPFLF